MEEHKIQIGTVDGLVNISDAKWRCYARSIQAFTQEAIDYSKKQGIALGTAFQRFTIPVVNGKQNDFNIKDIDKPVYTDKGKEQSPAILTYCKKMGLVYCPNENIFSLTPLATDFLNDKLSIEEFAFVILSKQGIFFDEAYRCNLLAFIASILRKTSFVSEDILKNELKSFFGDASIIKTRFDIILNGLETSSLLRKNNNSYCIASLQAAYILNCFYENQNHLSKALLDTDANYCNYIGDKRYGVYDLIQYDCKNVIRELFPNLEIQNESPSKNGINCRQRIFYGAPGTGKSHIIDKVTKKEKVVRTTFHPDSDYSTFVGAYKPTMGQNERVYSPEELIVKLSSIKNSGVTYPCQKFGAQYWESLKRLDTDAIKMILAACRFTDSMIIEVTKGCAVGEEYLNKKEGKILYTFVPQAFLQAYVSAWKMYASANGIGVNKQYLVIEEINRGNCAQIFGDLFQLLDRSDNGFSEYPIYADTDIQNYLKQEFIGMPDLETPAIGNLTAKEVAQKIKTGEILLLPNNLYIWATMNTSDQSLFPIDSAFKRRWDWAYMKIQNHRECNYKIQIGDAQQDWWEFIKKINDIIASMTSSADKQLGYFFCKADANGIISAEKFVSKVLFYLWNDVFKDYGFEDASLFRFKEIDEEGHEQEKDLTFPDFYNDSGNEVNEDRVVDFVKRVMEWKTKKEQ